MSEATLFRSRAGLAALVAVGLFLVFGLVTSASQPDPTDGPAGSTFATNGNGAAALAALLEGQGYEVAQARVPLATQPPDPTDVVIVVGGDPLATGDRAALLRHLDASGRIVLIGQTSGLSIATSRPHWTTATTSSSAGLLPIAGFDAIKNVKASEVWADSGSLLPVVGNEDGTLVGIEAVGPGLLVAVADAEVIANDALASGDNALLALLAVGEIDGPVRFVEYVHGFTQPTGLAALPPRWKQALLLAAIAGLVWLAGRGIRFGPPEQTNRDLPPPRAAYVDALALTLRASGDANATAPLRHAMRSELVKRGAANESPASWLETAVDSGIDRNTAQRALAPEGSEDPHAMALLLSRLVNKEQL